MRGDGGMGEGAGVSRESTLDANWIFERPGSITPSRKQNAGKGGGEMGGGAGGSRESTLDVNEMD